MTRRHAEKGATPRAAARRAGPRPTGLNAQDGVAAGETQAPARIESLEERLLAVERERDALRAQVATLQSRLNRLEEGQTEACNRLSWAIDAVQSILDNKG